MTEEDDRFHGIASVVLTQLDDVQRPWTVATLYERVKEWSADEDRGFPGVEEDEVHFVIDRLIKWGLIKTATATFSETFDGSVQEDSVLFLARTRFGARVAKIVAKASKHNVISAPA